MQGERVNYLASASSRNENRLESPELEKALEFLFAISAHSAETSLAPIQQPRVIPISTHAAVHYLQVIHDQQIAHCPSVFKDSQLPLG